MIISKSQTKIFTLILFLLFVNSICGQTDSIYTIPKGTQIRVRMDNEINSKVSSVNDTFTATVTDPVRVREIEILPAGLIVEGRITRVKSAAVGRKNGSFEVRFETLYLSDKVRRSIDASIIKTENSKSSGAKVTNAAAIGGGTAVGAFLGALFDKSRGALIGAGAGFGIGTSVVLLQKGKEARIRAAEKFTIILNQDVTLPPQDY